VALKRRLTDQPQIPFPRYRRPNDASRENDILDNLGHRSTKRLIPELQHLDVGDLVPLGPGKNSGMRVKEFEVGKWMVWWDAKLRLTSWTWQPRH
jgi:hypothetical protein